MNKFILGLVVIITIILAIIGLLSLIRKRTVVMTRKDLAGNCQLYINDKYVHKNYQNIKFKEKFCVKLN